MTFPWRKSKNKVFRRIQIFERPLNLKQMSPKKDSWVIYFYTDFFFGYLKNLVTIQCKLMFSKKYCLWTPFVTKCSECDLNTLALTEMCLGTTCQLDRTNLQLNQQKSVHFCVLGVNYWVGSVHYPWKKQWSQTSFQKCPGECPALLDCSEQSAGRHVLCIPGQLSRFLCYKIVFRQIRKLKRGFKKN